MTENQVFSVPARDHVRDRVLELAAADARIVAGAVVGSLALEEGDRWSDLDLTFAVAGETPIYAVLEDWTIRIGKEFGAVRLFDLPSGASIYRVFLLPGCLQLDLSFTPAAQFGATSPRFRLLFGGAAPKPHPQPPSAHELFGYAVHHALRARFCIERGRFWQAEYWISSARDYALSLACRRRGLNTSNARGFDALPPAVSAHFLPSLVTALQREELLRALTIVITGLLSETDEVHDLAAQVEPELRKLTMPWE